jgi:signal transduction histidine kinase
LYHGIYRRFSYIPIALAGIWFGLRGGILIAVLSSLAFIPHLLLYIGQGPELYMGEVMEVFLYLAAGSSIGFIAGREAQIREKYRVVAEKLETSYQKLHNETELLLEAEKQLAASQKFSALGQLSASLAHEIKNPLASIRGAAEIFLDEFPEGHPKREFAKIMLKETSRLNVTVNDVLGYSRGQQKIDGKREPLSDVIERVANLVGIHLKKKYIKFDMSGLENGRDFLVNGDKISQVLLNIILNSIEALSQNGRVVLQVSLQEEGVEIVMSDDGPGIPEQERQRIFESFVTGKEGGTGLGLAISKKIVESYGGSIRYRDSEIGGASFAVFLPKESSAR